MARNKWADPEDNDDFEVRGRKKEKARKAKHDELERYENADDQENKRSKY
jgi:hypothetical protein